MALLLTACGGGTAEAEAAAEECSQAGGERLTRDGSALLYVVTGDDAVALGNLDSDTTDPELLADAGIAALGTLLTLECLVGATGYPGSVDDLADGDEWDGWRYIEEDTVGSEIRFTFEAN